MGEAAKKIVEVKQDETERPVFAFAKMGLRTQMRFTELQLEQQQLQKEAMAAQQTVQALLEDDPKAAVPDDVVQALAKVQKIGMELVEIAGKVLVSVPDSWLVEDAPETIDWRDNESLDYIRGDMSNALVEAFARASAERFQPGN